MNRKKGKKTQEPFHRSAEYTGTGVCLEIIFLNRNGGKAQGNRNIHTRLYKRYAAGGDKGSAGPLTISRFNASI